jgi:ergothioneine biosynthesis protein EgtB
MTAPALQLLAADLYARFLATRRATRELAAPLSAEDCAIQSMPDASPTKWHLAHTSWFFETFVLAPSDPRYGVFDPTFKVLFNSYYNAVGDKHPRARRGMLSRPPLATILSYRSHVDEAIAARLQSGSFDAERLALIELGIQHEQQHQELILTDLKHLLACNPAKPAYRGQWPLTSVHASRPQWISFEGGLREIGHGGEGFSFDNETPRHRVWVEPFALASRLVTNGEYIAFMEDGGYARPELWLSAGWEAVVSQGWEAPMYWERVAGAWHTFTLHGRVPVEPNTPLCHVSLYEAEAFSRWCGARLPTEAEWEVAAEKCPVQGNFLESGALHPLAMREAPAPGELAQMFGDAWEWTRSDYAPYPRYQPAAGAVGEYNGKFMCNQYVLRGGSCATPRSHIRASYRNFFPAEARWQFTGLRLARDA